MPVLSVIMTTYNCEKYIREAVESILNQTFADFEFFIVDDCSTDGTQSIVESYRDPRIIYLKNESNLGQTQSLNIGLTRCQGEYIARMDADDISYPDRFAKQIVFLEKNPEIAVLGTWCLDINQQGKPLRIYKTPIDPREIKCNLAGSGDLTAWSVNHPTVMMRRRVLQDVGFYDAQKGKGQGYPQDYELWSRLSPKYEFANMPEVLVQYRILQNSDSRFYNEKQIKDREDVTKEKILRFLPKISDADLFVLQCMLEYKPQHSFLNGERVYPLFEQYFKSYMDEEFSQKTTQWFMNRMKLYYLPLLSKTNPGLSVKEFFKLVIKYPVFLFNGKFYRKLAKVFLGSVLSKEKYHFLIKKLFLFR